MPSIRDEMQKLALQKEADRIARRAAGLEIVEEAPTPRQSREGLPFYRQPALAAALAGLGFVLLIVGQNWQSLTGSSVYWSEQDQQKYEQAAVAFHKAAYDPKLSDEEKKQFKQTYESENSRLESARDLRSGIGRGLFWLGVSGIAVGAAVYFLNKES